MITSIFHLCTSKHHLSRGFIVCGNRSSFRLQALNCSYLSAFTSPSLTVMNLHFHLLSQSLVLLQPVSSLCPPAFHPRPTGALSTRQAVASTRDLFLVLIPPLPSQPLPGTFSTLVFSLAGTRLRGALSFHTDTHTCMHTHTHTPTHAHTHTYAHTHMSTGDIQH